jgi:TusA-related sulfurtransferase
MTVSRASKSSKPLDLRGLPCPFVLAEITQVLGGQQGNVIEVLCDHPTTVHETVPRFCRKHGYELDVQPEIYPLHGQAFRLRIVA